MIEMRKPLISLDKGMEEFISYCKIKNLAQDSIDFYNDSFKYFLKFINSNFEKFDIHRDMKKGIIDKYILYMQEQNLKDSTINIKLRGIRCILYYFMENSYIVPFKIKTIKETNTLPTLYTDNEIKKLLKKPNMKKCNFAEYRTWAVINFFVATGVRSRTLRNIKIKDLDFQNELISLTTMKRRKPIIIPMSITLKKILIEYLRIRGNQPEDYLFCNLEGKQLTRYALSNIVSKYNRSRNVEKTGIHAFRHYFAKSYIQNGGSIVKLQKILCHSTISQTQKYVDLFSQDLQKDFEQYNPLDKLCMNNERIKMRR